MLIECICHTIHFITVTFILQWENFISQHFNATHHPSGNHLFLLSICKLCPVLFVQVFCLFCSMCKETHTAFIFLCLTYFTQRNTFQIHPKSKNTKQKKIYAPLCSLHLQLQLLRVGSNPGNKSSAHKQMNGYGRWYVYAVK